MATKTIVLTELTVRQKNSNTHTKFMLTPSGTPFPQDNFSMALEWGKQGLLDDKVYEILQIIEKGSTITFRGAIENLEDHSHEN